MHVRIDGARAARGSGPLAGGLLSGKFSRAANGPEQSRRMSFDFPPVDKERAYDIVDVLRPMAEQCGASVARLALAWLLHQKAVTSVIIGAKDGGAAARQPCRFRP